MKRQSGFTLIELIIVIVILGILAVTAAPQFFNFGSDARQSTVRGLEGSIKAASELVHARAQLNTQTRDNSEDEEESFVVVRDGVTALVVDQYAAASDDGIASALQLGNDWTQVTVNNMPDNSYVLGPQGYSQEGANWTNDSTGCFVYYTWPATGSSQPIIGSRTGGC